MAEDYVLQTKITADSTQFDATLKKTGKSLTAFSSEITKVTKLLGTLFVGQKIVNFAKTSVDSIEKERKEINLLNTTLKTTGATAWTTQQQLVDMAKAFERESNYTSEQIQRAQTVMLGFKTVTGDVFNSAMQNVLDMSEVMGMDLVSAVQTVGKALDDPVKGLGSLQRQGFAFSESQKAMLEEMVKTGRQAEAQKIILDELATTYGGASKAGQNAFQQLNIAVGNLQKAIGENLAPVVESIATDITELINQFNSLDKGTQTFILTAGSLLTTLPLIVKGINALKVALVSLQTSVPVLLAITAGIAGLSAVVGAVVKKKNEFSELSKEITKISSTTKNYLDTYSEGNEEKKLDEKATKELIKLYPELSGKVSAYTTSVEDARDAVNDLVNKKLVDAESSGIKGYIQRLNDIKKLNEEVNKLTSHKNKLDENMAKEIQNVSIPAIQKLADEERNSINERLKAIGKFLTLEGTIVEIPIELTPAKNLEETKKSWQEALKEVLKIGGDFSTGKEAVNIYLSNMEEALKQDKRISEALGEKFDISSALKAQQEQIAQVIAELLQQTDIDKPFDIEELSKESTALGALAQAYKEMGEVISSTNQTISEESTEWTDKLLDQEIAILEKRRDNEIEWAKNAKKSEDEIYAIRADYVEKINELQVKQLNSQRDAEIKKVKNSKQSAESQEKIISQINEYYDKQIDLMNEATEKFTKKSGGFLEEWSKQYQSLAGNWTQTAVDMADTIGGAFKETFSTLGEELVEGGGSFEDYAAVAVEAISQVLQALAAQLAALAAARAANYDYATASLAAAGAAAALVASGVMSGIAKSMKKVREETKSTSEAISNFAKTIEELKEANTNLSGFADIVARSNDLIRTSMLNLADIVNKNEKALSLFNMTTSDFWRLVENTSTSAEKLADVLNILSMPIAGINSDNYKDTVKAIEQYRNALKFLDDSLNDVRKSLDETNKSLEANAWAYRYIISNYTDVTAQETKSKLLQGFIEVLETVATIGADIGETMMDSISDGASKSDFMLQMKKMLRENMIKLTVYNSEFTENLSRISGDLSKAILQNSESQIQSAVTEIEKLYDTASEVAKRVDDVLSGMFAGYEEEADEVVDIFSELQKAIQSFRDSFVDIGSEVADKLIAGISDGLKEQELFEVIKNYIRENIIKASVYADYASELAEIGKSITAGIVDKSGAELENAKNKISKIYREMTESMQAIDEMLGDIFGKSTVEAVEDTAETVVDNLSKLENAINSFKESIADVGADIASNLINGLTNGLSQSDFLTNMKDWLRKMLLQAVVYTETMKNEIEAIGKAISAGISGGFTDTSLHEIRRDLSYIFEQANKSVGKIDEVLGGVFGYANGTNNATRGLHIVGEDGPELVNFRGGEQVLNNRNTQKALASVDSGNTFNVAFYNTADTTAYAMMSQLRQYNREMAINGVL